MEACADLQQACHTPAQCHPPFSRLRDSTEDLEKGALASTVPPNNSDDLTLVRFEVYVLKRPKFLDLVALEDLPPPNQITGVAREILGFACYDVPQRRMVRPLRRLMSHEIPLGQVLD